MSEPSATPPTFDAKAFLKELTRQPGVYQMYDKDAKILYVGKAKNLRNRVSSYFRKSGLSPKTEALVKRIHSIEVTVAPSEADALVLEHNLIKTQRPPFNILLRDDKSYPYIYVSTEQEYPRLALHRGAKKKKGRYFGPYPNASAVRESLQFLQKTFLVRQCEDSVFRNRTRPCLQYQIGRCTGPCVGAISPEEYAKDVKHTEMFLEGRSDSLQADLVKAMEEASHALDFESAAEYRDKISALRHVQAEHAIESGQSNIDIIACARNAGEVCIHLLFIRHGRMLGSKSYFQKDKLAENEGEILNAFLPQLYLGGRSMDVPSEIVLSHTIEDEAVLGAVLHKEVGRQVIISDSVRTHRARWLSMAIQTAEQNVIARVSGQQAIHAKLEALQKALDLDDLPQRLECFDISHSSGEATVASCVVFNKEGPLKSDYRRFNIEGVTAGDDFAAMKQALTRRYSRQQKEGRQLPDILVVDGGKGQMTQAKSVMEDLALSQTYLLGIAKGVTRKPGFETLILPNGREKVLKSDDPALHVLQQLRDEAHRFAVTGHKQARDKRRKKSRLEDIPGIGPKRRRELLQYFGGLQEVMSASVHDISKVPGISKKMAEEVYSALHSG